MKYASPTVSFEERPTLATGVPSVSNWSTATGSERGVVGQTRHSSAHVQRQVHRQNSTFSGRSTGQDLRPLLGRLLNGRSWLALGQSRRSALRQQLGMTCGCSWVNCVEKPCAEIGAGASLSAARRLRPPLCGGCGGWHRDQLGHLAGILYGCC